MKGTLHMLVGLPSSGKSTQADVLRLKLEQDGIDVVIRSSDELRERLFGSRALQIYPNELFEILHKIIELDLKLGRYVIYDATNINRKRRENFLKQVSPLVEKKLCTLMLTPLQLAIDRDKEREYSVGEAAIMKMARAFQVPMPFEGFDDIDLVLNLSSQFEDDLDDYVSLIPHLEKFNQDNKHHDFNLYEHQRRTASMFGYDEPVIRNAALCHDIGKIYTKTFFDKKGNESESAHYYNHANVGAYMYLCFKRDLNDCTKEFIDDMLKTAYLIEKHMERKDPKMRSIHESMRKDLRRLQIADDLAKKETE